MATTSLESVSTAPTPPEAATLKDLTPAQWKSGIAAWLGWLFDGLDMHLYSLVAAPFVAELLRVSSPLDPLVKEKSAFIQAAFLVGWALGGAFFGRLGDLIGRSRVLALTIFTYAIFTGLSFFAQAWWHLLIFRFVAALGIGGEWAVGSSLLAETWPKRWRPWIAAVLQTGVNLGIVLAGLTTFLLAGCPKRYVFLVGVLPALIVFWIRRAVPEPPEWHAARSSAGHDAPGLLDLFRGAVRHTTLLTIAVCATSLSAWWAFIFWINQYWRRLPEIQSWSSADKDRLTSTAFSAIIGISIAGNFFAGWVARRLGYRRAISLLFLGMLLTMLGGFCVPRTHTSLMPWVLGTGFFSGVFGLFTMYLPPLFPTLLRTTGAGFCYNIGRIAAAFGTVLFGLFAPVDDFRIALLIDGLLFLPALIVAWMMPDLEYRDKAVEQS